MHSQARAWGTRVTIKPKYHIINIWDEADTKYMNQLIHTLLPLQFYTGYHYLQIKIV